MKRLLKLALAVWLVRWAAGEAASQLGRRAGPAPRDSPRPPGWMQGPFEG